MAIVYNVERNLKVLLEVFYRALDIDRVIAMHIRKATKADIYAIHKLDKEAVDYHRKFDKDLYQVSEKWWKIKKDSQIEALSNIDNLILVAEEGDEIIGFIWGYVEKMAELSIGKIQDIVVNEKHRGKGIATLLIKEMFLFFKQQNCIISEATVNAQNMSAIKTYEKAGFKIDECKMRLKLDKTRRFSPFV